MNTFLIVYAVSTLLCIAATIVERPWNRQLTVKNILKYFAITFIPVVNIVCGIIAILFIYGELVLPLLNQYLNSCNKLLNKVVHEPKKKID